MLRLRSIGALATGVLFSSLSYQISHADEANIQTKEVKHNPVIVPVNVTTSMKDKITPVRIEVQPAYTIDEAGDVQLDPLQYKRIDRELLNSPKFKAFHIGNALHDTLTGRHRVEKYEVYRKIGHDEVVAIVHFGDKINGHPTIVHGGITSLVFDNTFGWLFFGLDLPLAVTANLNVNYRSPLPMNTTCLLEAKLVNIEGRKMFMEAKMRDLNGKMIADSTSLFVALKPAAAMAARVQMKVAEYLN